jgi:hypothetical protein
MKLAAREIQAPRKSRSLEVSKFPSLSRPTTMAGQLGAGAPQIGVDGPRLPPSLLVSERPSHLGKWSDRMQSP